MSAPNIQYIQFKKMPDKEWLEYKVNKKNIGRRKYMPGDTLWFDGDKYFIHEVGLANKETFKFRVQKLKDDYPMFIAFCKRIAPNRPIRIANSLQFGGSMIVLDRNNVNRQSYEFLWKKLVYKYIVDPEEITVWLK
jgi:hypothetical protein